MRERRSNSVPSCRTGLITKNITRRMTHSLYLTLLTAGTSLGLVVLMPLEAAHAGGFFVQEASTSGAGAAYAGQAATARDSSVIFHNPAGIALLDEAQVNAGIHFLYSHSELEDQGSTVAGFPLGSAPGPLSPYNAFTDDGGNPYGLSPIPNLYGAMPVTDDKRLWVGAGIAAPFGVVVEYDPGFFGSFLAKKIDLTTIDFTPTLAYRVSDKLTLGASAIIQYGEINLQVVTPDTSLLRVKGDDIAYGYKIGATYQARDDLTFGLHYRSRVNQDFEGDVDPNPVVTGGVASGGEGTLNLPDIINFGVSYDVNDKWTALLGVDWYGWGATDTVTITPDTGIPVALEFAYENTMNVSIGAEYRYSDELVLRAGYQYDETPTTIEGRSAINPDANRHWFAVGGTYDFRENMSLDFGLTYIRAGDGNIDQTRGGVGPLPAIEVIGESQENYGVIGTVGVNYRF